MTRFTENLAFKYKLPKINDELTGNITEQEYENDPYENFEADEGRFYTWNSAMGTEANFWSSDAAEEQAWGLVIENNDNSSVEISSKAFAYTIVAS